MSFLNQETLLVIPFGYQSIYNKDSIFDRGFQIMSIAYKTPFKLKNSSGMLSNLFNNFTALRGVTIQLDDKCLCGFG